MGSCIMDALDDREVTINDTLIVFFLQDYGPEDEQPWQIVYEELNVINFVTWMKKHFFVEPQVNGINKQSKLKPLSYNNQTKQY